ncbi:DUF2975 domain-containing protein [Ktedonobacter racemifer]|uniref:DUF2975 domain-containing protein n=1 Tax=Ktedonobacter racemifer DSM 44963 TaxID=485913 RepID=D6U5P1_KTERA|nr:DUF2975 domain-containing protein [Ktedonobacter racemifer]EFH80302.1 conserved hypothetical protein [Ktedonobacter racemifer DSM 44963]
MKRSSTLFLKVVLLLVAIGALAGMIRFPQTEGRATHLDLISIYTDPFIIYGYMASIPFFVVLYQAFKLLNLIDADKAFSQGAVNILKNMKFASLSLIGFIALAEFYIRFFAHGDDPAGPTALGILASFAAIVIATAAAVFQKLLQNAVDIKSENDLTV